MPLVRIDHAVGKPAPYRATISEGGHDAMVRTFDVPDDDRFQIIDDHAPGTAIVHPTSYLGIEHSDDLVTVQITCNDTLPSSRRMNYPPPLRIVWSSLVEVKKENWSFGNGVAQYAAVLPSSD